MGSLLGFVFVYTLGGITFIPLLLAAVLLHAYLTFPLHEDTAADTAYREPALVRPGDDIDAIKTAQKTLGEKFQARSNHEADVAAGYFAVCREYTPGGVNGKPPERTTPVGSTTVSAPSPSVYQSMYRSIFDRKQTNSPLDNKGAGRPQRRGGNVFYVVLRHGHLMLFDDDEQLEVRHVVSLAHHNVSIYSGGDETPEGELFIKRNALCLSRRTDAGEITPDGKASKPFYLFSENCSEKEDFYFALLRNQERKPDAKNNPPIPLHYDVKDIITLVQKLHSSEEHLQTRWINAVIGRIFLAMYKTPEIENFIRAKITKKISRVKTPSFLSKIELRNIYLGEAAPVITNPKLKDLTVDGEMVVEADVKYSGNFRIEVAATARIELGSRFKAREVNLLLAVVLKRVEGHAMIRIKPPPSNRFWTTFATMPKIDMSIEPIVSSRQITYTLILRQIENRIKEVVAESLVFPNWDDSPFSHSEGKLWRGGIWADDRVAVPHDAETAAAQDGHVDELQHLDGDEPIEALPHAEKSITMPVVDASPGPSSPTPSIHSRKSTKSVFNLGSIKSGGSSTSIETKSPITDKPRVLRSGSFASASSPTIGTDITNADAFKSASPPEHSHAGAAMAAISALSQSTSPIHTPIGSPSRPSRIQKSGSQSSGSSEHSLHHDIEKPAPTPQPSVNFSEILGESPAGSYPPSPASTSAASFKSEAPSMKSFANFGRERREDSNSSSGKSSAGEQNNKRISLAAVAGAAAVTAKKWGWNIQRQGDQKGESSTESPEKPVRPLVMGRGQPLPPPGTPLPPPDKKTKTAPIPVPKRKAIPPPNLPERHNDGNESNGGSRHSLPPPPLPKRRSRDETKGVHETGDDGLLVVEAPANDSEPTTPLTEEPPAYMPPWVEDTEEIGEEKARPQPLAIDAKTPPRLPRRRQPNRVLSGSPEEDGHQLPSWMAAQEEEARAKSSFVDDDAGLQ
ncbi:putative PH domain-containing protein [Lachnellula suecica]|uniref:Putative PH domain-containing protein n=1 Tax=Lachnellula suecica TaxID=602035 RepID=A0A8T9C0S8_9HELO|nr:putative PH domain-containing protein [Lachnellula suecica]